MFVCADEKLVKIAKEAKKKVLEPFYHFNGDYENVATKRRRTKTPVFFFAAIHVFGGYLLI